ncbi:syndecan-like isoform X4 [Sitodiplosis mosellana]|uniref:syndecan-like isoform X4 n=1 Tax=Sitodiplosis mosellana TaxID=263140 RepID=UPI0024437BFF|nr:syndecan-like isoform X4 [Sitodiplosis mosellana]
MSSIWINLSTPFIILVALIFTLHSQNGVLATEQKNSTDVKPETPLWQISSTQTPVVPTSSSIETSTLLGPTPTSQGIQTPSSSVSSTSVSQPHNTARDEIYIDDEGLEGSGGRGEIHDDLEKEPEYSGSGFGPDDEDSSSSTPHRKKVNGGYKSTNAGNGGYKATNNEKPPIEDIDSDLTEGSEIEPGKTGKSDIATTKPIPGIDTPTGNEVFIMDNRGEDRTASFFAQPGILAAVIGGAVVGLLCAILVVMFIVYRMRKKDEGSYALDEPKRSPAVNSYAKNANNREFYA